MKIIRKFDNLKELQDVITLLVEKSGRTAEEIYVEDVDGLSCFIELAEETLSDGSTVFNVKMY